MSDQTTGYLIGAAITGFCWLIGWLINCRRDERHWIKEADEWNVRFPWLPIETSASMKQKITGGR